MHGPTWPFGHAADADVFFLRHALGKNRERTRAAGREWEAAGAYRRQAGVVGDGPAVQRQVGWMKGASSDSILSTAAAPARSSSVGDPGQARMAAIPVDLGSENG
jgi:hypothetical protein